MHYVKRPDKNKPLNALAITFVEEIEGIVDAVCRFDCELKHGENLVMINEGIKPCLVDIGE